MAKGDRVYNMLLTQQVSNGSFDTNDTIFLFIIIVVVIFGLVFGGSLIVSTYPSKFFVQRLHQHPMLDINTFYFYYQKVTAYRMLFSIHTIFTNTFKILGSTTTFITVYCAVDSNDYILLFSLISAMCQVVTLLIPTDKYAKIYVEAARILESELNSIHRDDNEAKEKLKEAYEKAEEIIQKDFV